MNNLLPVLSKPHYSVYRLTCTERDTYYRSIHEDKAHPTAVRHVEQTGHTMHLEAVTFTKYYSPRSESNEQ